MGHLQALTLKRANRTNPQDQAALMLGNEVLWGLTLEPPFLCVQTELIIASVGLSVVGY
jgi:hypothetical protein